MSRKRNFFSIKPKEKYYAYLYTLARVCWSGQMCDLYLLINRSRHGVRDGPSYTRVYIDFVGWYCRKIPFQSLCVNINAIIYTWCVHACTADGIMLIASPFPFDYTVDVRGLAALRAYKRNSPEILNVYVRSQFFPILLHKRMVFTRRVPFGIFSPCNVYHPTLEPKSIEGKLDKKTNFQSK